MSAADRSREDPPSPTRRREDTHEGDDTMFVLAVNHDVEDYDRWKRVFDGFHQGDLGARFYRVNRNIEDPDNITVVHGFDTVEAALAFRDHPDLKEAMGDAGVASAPRFEIFEEVDSGTY